VTGDSSPRNSVHADDRTPILDSLSMLSEQLRAFFGAVPAEQRDDGGAALDRAIAALGQVDDADRRILVVTHNFVIAGFVRNAVGAPPMRWMDLGTDNGALTVLRYRADRLPRLIAFNDTGHLATL